MRTHPALRGPSLVAATLAALSLLGPVTAGATTLIGTNLGLSVLSEDGSSRTVFGIPHSGDVFLGGLRPGLRLGGIAASGAAEFYLDTGLSYTSSEGESFHSIVNTANYQHNFSPASSTRPFVTAGAGFGQVGGDFGDGATFLILGGGMGFRHWLAHGHGAMRAEFRYDRVSDTDADSDANVLSLKLGFDLVLGGK